MQTLPSPLPALQHICLSSINVPRAIFPSLIVHLLLIIPHSYSGPLALHTHLQSSDTWALPAARPRDEGVSFALNPIPLDNGWMSYTGSGEAEGWANTAGDDLRGHLSGSQWPQCKWELPQSCSLNKGSLLNGRRWCHGGIFPELRNSRGRAR